MKIDPIKIYDSPIARFMEAEAFVLYPFIFFSTVPEQACPSLYKHELTHVDQVEREGFIPFYVKYFIEQAKVGYWENPYEVEAYQAQTKPLTNDNIRRLGLPADFPKTDAEYTRRRRYKRGNQSKSKKARRVLRKCKV